MIDSFKEIYAKDKEAQKAEKLGEQIVTTTDEKGSTNTTITIDPKDGTVMPSVPTMTVLDVESVEPSTLTEDIKDVLTEQREQSAKVLESVMKTNTKIANNVSKFVKANSETNEKLVEAITALTDKIALLETKLEAIENLEIPTPIVHVQMPRVKVIKEIKRNKNDLITHIEETEVPLDDEDE